MTLTTRRRPSRRDPGPSSRGTDPLPPQGEKGGTDMEDGPATDRPPATQDTGRAAAPPQAQAPALLLAGEDQDDADPHIVRGID